MWQIFELVVKYTDIRDWMHKKGSVRQMHHILEGNL